MGLVAKTKQSKDAGSVGRSSDRATEDAGMRRFAATRPATSQEVLVLDFGGQYSQLIARRVRECGVFSELLPHHVSVEAIRARSPRGLILSGGPASVYADGAPKLRTELL